MTAASCSSKAVSSGSCQLQTPTQGQTSVCISGEMKSLAEALTRALVTTVRVYCQWNSIQGMLDTGQRSWLPPGPWPVVGSLPRVQGRQLEGSWALVPSPAAGFIGGLDSPHPSHSPSGLKNTNLFKLSGAGKARSPRLGCFSRDS